MTEVSVNKNMKVFVVGSFVQACCWFVDRWPKKGETFFANDLSIEVGGKGLNVAVGTSRMGAEVAILLGVGRDSAGDNVLTILKKENISIDFVYRLADKSGYGAGIFENPLNADFQSAIAVYPGPNLELKKEHAESAREKILNSNLVYGQFEASVEAVQRAFELAKNKKEITTVLNPSPWYDISPDLFAVTDIIVVNEVEAVDLLQLSQSLSGLNRDDIVSIIKSSLEDLWQKWQGKLLIITLSVLGSVAFTKSGECIFAQGVLIDEKDPVGAGDAFSSALCWGLLQGLSLPEILNYANHCGAMVAATVGVLDALPSLEKLEFFKNK